MTAVIAEPKLTVAQAKMQAIRDYQQTIFFERDEEIVAWLATVMARGNVLGLGDPGTAKSDMVHEFAKCVAGSRYFWQLMDRQMDKSELTGMMSLAYYKQTSGYKREIAHTLFEAHFAFFDEVDKAGSVKNVVLTAINEGMGKIGGEEGWIQLPLISSFAAINVTLDAQDRAFTDRFLTKLILEDLKSDDSVLALLRSATTPRNLTPRPTIELAELVHAIDVEVPAVVVPEAIFHAMAAIRHELHKIRVRPSPRRMKQSVRLLQAAAWLDGRTTVMEEDLAILRHVLWEDEATRPKAVKIVLDHTGPVTAEAIKILQTVAEAQQQLDAAVSTQESDTSLASLGGELQGTVKLLQRRIAKARTEFGDRPTVRLDEAEVAVRELHREVLVSTLNTPHEHATVIAGL